MAERIDVHMRQTDAFAWHMEDDPVLRSTIVAVALLEKSPDWDRFVELADRATRVIPSFRQKVVDVPLKLATPRWTVDPEFDLSWHLRRMRAPEPGTFDVVLDYARQTAMAGFDRARPLWEFTLVEGLDDGGAAVIMKIHHSLTDGIGGMQLALQIVDFTPDGSDRGPMPDAPEPEEMGPADLFRDALANDWSRVFGIARDAAGTALPTAAKAARHPFQAAAEAMRTARSIAKFVAPVTETLSPVMRDRHMGSHFDALDVPLEGLRNAAHAGGYTLNDAFMAALLGGLRRYHARHDTEVSELRVTLPISIRKEDDPAGGNRITLVRFVLPVEIEDPVERMKAVDAMTTAWRQEPVVPLTNTIAGAMNLLPRAVTGAMLKHVDFVASNVPGSPVPVYIAGALMRRYYAFGPTIGAALNITLMSYAGVCCIGVNCDTGAVTDPGTLVECLAEGFDEILDLAGDHGPVVVATHS